MHIFFYIVFDYFVWLYVVFVAAGLSLWMPETHQNHAWHISDWRLLTLNYNPLCVPPYHPSVSWLSFKPNTTEPSKKRPFLKEQHVAAGDEPDLPRTTRGLGNVLLGSLQATDLYFGFTTHLLWPVVHPHWGGTWWIIIYWIPLHQGC